MTEPLIGNGNTSGIAGADMLALVAHITELLAASERRIIDRLNENSSGATERWHKHDEELASNTARVIDRFEKLELDLLEVSRCIHGHLAKEHDEEVALQARVAPVRTLASWLAINWRSIALALLALMGALSWVGLDAHVAGH